MIRILKLYERFGIVLFIVAGFVFLSAVSPNFLKANTLLNVLAQAAHSAIVGFGMTLAITSGGFDLSVESVMALTSVFLSLLIPQIGILPAVVASVLIACVVGFLNGVIIAKLKVNPLITTLSMMTIIQGVALLVAGGRMIVILQKEFMEVGTGKTLGIPNPIYLMIVFFILFYVILYHTPFGRHISAVGSNENAARISGLRVDAVKIAVYILVAFTSGTASVIRTSQALIGMPSMASGFVLVAITVTILGGTSLAGGRGNLWGTLLAAVFISMIYYGLNLINVQIYYQYLSVGLVLLFALFVEGLRVRYLQAAKARGIKV
jgi:ribose transport system permease protein